MKFQKADLLLLSALISLLSPFITWRLFEWYRESLVHLAHELAWSDGALFGASCLIFMSFLISIIVWLAERKW